MSNTNLCPELCAIARARVNTRSKATAQAKNRPCKHHCQRQPCNRTCQRQPCNRTCQHHPYNRTCQRQPCNRTCQCQPCNRTCQHHPCNRTCQRQPCNRTCQMCTSYTVNFIIIFISFHSTHFPFKTLIQNKNFRVGAYSHLDGD